MHRNLATGELRLSPAVQDFAAEQGVAAYLPQVLAMTRQLFPDARRLAIDVEDDPEIPQDRHLVIEVDVAGLSVDQYVAARFQWGQELFQLCPAPLVCVFRCALGLVEP